MFNPSGVLNDHSSLPVLISNAPSRRSSPINAMSFVNETPPLTLSCVGMLQSFAPPWLKPSTAAEAGEFVHVG
jgi:hypothetical protein